MVVGAVAIGGGCGAGRGGVAGPSAQNEGDTAGVGGVLGRRWLSSPSSCPERGGHSQCRPYPGLLGTFRRRSCPERWVHGQCRGCFGPEVALQPVFLPRTVGTPSVSPLFWAVRAPRGGVLAQNGGYTVSVALVLGRRCPPGGVLAQNGRYTVSVAPILGRSGRFRRRSCPERWVHCGRLPHPAKYRLLPRTTARSA